jgi:hypothetical protein
MLEHGGDKMKKNGKVVKLHGVTYDVHTHKNRKSDIDVALVVAKIVIVIALVTMSAYISNIATTYNLIHTAKLYINEDTAYVDFGGQVHEYDYTPITGRYVK